MADVRDIGCKFPMRSVGFLGLGIGQATECLRQVGRSLEIHMSFCRVRRCSLLWTLMLRSMIYVMPSFPFEPLILVCESAISSSAMVKGDSGPSSVVTFFLGYLLSGVNGVSSNDSGKKVLAVRLSTPLSDRPVAREILLKLEGDFFLPLRARKVFHSLRLWVSLLKLSQCSIHLVFASSFSYLFISLCLIQILLRSQQRLPLVL